MTLIVRHSLSVFLNNSLSLVGIEDTHRLMLASLSRVIIELHDMHLLVEFILLLHF